MKKIISLFLSIIILISAVFTVNLTAFATTYTGNCGDGSTGNTVAYTLDDETGILTITGKGKMKDVSDKYSIFAGDGKETYYLTVKKVRVLSGVTSIGRHAFCGRYYYWSGSGTTGGYYRSDDGGFPNLVSVELNNGLIEIGEGAFKKCNSLESINIPSTTTNIAKECFYACTKLNSVKLGNNVKSLGESAFDNDSALNTLEISTNLETVGKNCFYNCSSLDGNLTFGSKLSYIGQNAFNKCSNLDSITIYNKDCEIYDNNTTIPLSIKIYGHIGSTAQEYAETYGNEFEAIDGATSTTVLPTCTEQGYDLLICNDCNASSKSNYTDALGHKEISKTAKAPTCTEDGYTNGYVCSVCGEVISGCETISATGHTEKITKPAVAPTCTKTGLTAEIVCDTCGEILQEQAVVDALGHDYINTVVPATCKSKGYTVHTCSLCNDTYTDSLVDVASHDYKSTVTTPATCTITGVKTFTCSICGDSYTEVIEKVSHTAETDKAVAPTCLSSGLTEGSHCSVCGYVISKQEVVNAIGHTPKSAVEENRTAPTCTKAGSYDLVVYCDTCNTELSRENNVVPATDHSYNADVINPTCKDKGYTTYTCDICGDSYKADYTDITTTHDYKSTVTTPATCTSTGVKTFTCSICGDSYTEVIEKVSHTAETDKAVAPTCLSSGLTEGSHCSVCGYVISKQEVVNAIGHTPKSAVEENRTAPTCTKAGSYDLVVYCDTCNTELSRENNVVPATDHSYNAYVINPTCKDKGYTTYTCDICGDSYKADYIDVITTHDYKSAIITPATCTAKGIKKFTCSVCGDSYTEDIAMVEHTIVTDKAVAPTCKTSGLTEGSHCSTCGTVIVAQMTVNATHHSPATAVEENRTEATCQKAGSVDLVIYCSICNEELSRTTSVIPVVEHSYVQTVVAPTCETKGYTLNKCTNCGESYKDSFVDTTNNHNYKTVVTVQPTCTEKGVEKHSCTICGDTYNTDIEMIEHTAVTDNAVAPTCTTTGLTEGSHCSVCGTVLVAQTAVTATGHESVSMNNAVAPTCTKEGKESDTKCSTCGVKLTTGKTIPAKGHKYTTKVVKPTYAAKGYTLHSCSVCKSSYKDTYTNKLTVAKPTISKVTSPKSKQIKVTWGKKSYTGYQVQIATDRKFTKNQKTVTIKKASTVSTTFTKLKGKTKYYVRVRAYKTYNGKNYYSAWSKAKYVTTKR